MYKTTQTIRINTNNNHADATPVQWLAWAEVAVWYAEGQIIESSFTRPSEISEGYVQVTFKHRHGVYTKENFPLTTENEDIRSAIIIS